ncbi:MAG: TusE/DsrC/DsvC family sulfur relay protein [Desulfobulbus sp.]|jgi:tRNA 2-thiouridine synthesizing protein E|uniref:TusE/DsrC/DsvC family sulfur relay protein n=1 Tax=Desulfobulbus sp. TaxID=895 RepID=UPI002846533E|nr:TusE/DsrC/DsvC family sulfur relay protein [Desulfobulbus sp.]MDR2550293.1 TusE/DsrC/DsvC family sulfur relay protein [Desulfobulbus sp.]
MQHFSYQDTTYQVDDQGFLLDPGFWDANFAEGVARECGIDHLTGEHWDAINSLRELCRKSGTCPTVFAVCRAIGLRPREMMVLFPTGYHRGLCRIAGVDYLLRRLPDNSHALQSTADLKALSGKKQYQVDVRGFLIDPDNWDPYYAMHRALEMKIPQGELTDGHWRVVYYLRDVFKREKRIPTIYETCEKCQLELEELEALFPDGYHRGALKIAGLRFVK